MRLGVVMSGNSARSKAYGLVEVEIASRRGAENLEGCNGAEWYGGGVCRAGPPAGSASVGNLLPI